jgi:hypothetical protein
VLNKLCLAAAAGGVYSYCRLASIGLYLLLLVVLLLLQHPPLLRWHGCMLLLRLCLAAEIGMQEARLCALTLAICEYRYCCCSKHVC